MPGASCVHPFYPYICQWCMGETILGLGPPLRSYWSGVFRIGSQAEAGHFAAFSAHWWRHATSRCYGWDELGMLEWERIKGSCSCRFHLLVLSNLFMVTHLWKTLRFFRFDDYFSTVWFNFPISSYHCHVIFIHFHGSSHFPSSHLPASVFWCPHRVGREVPWHGFQRLVPS